LLAWPAVAQLPTFAKKAPSHTRARLIMSHDAARPGETVFAGIELTMDAGYHTYWKNPGDSGIATTIGWEVPRDITAGEILWPTPEKFVAEGLTTWVYHDRAVLLVPLTIATNAAVGPREVTALVKWLECKTDGSCIPGSNLLTAELTVGTESKPSAENALIVEAQKKIPKDDPQSAPASAGAGEKKSIWAWLAYAFIGGLILNIMPCVLPVIALKILGFVAQSREHPKRVRVLGMMYTLGVVASFLVLAGLVIGLKAAGQKAGWGIQFSNPQFIVVLTVVVTLVALNLFGVFEVTLSGGAMTSASEAASRHGTAGAFMNGVLATVLATPCTAPFLGAALGFAFAQSAAIIVLFFVTIALGLALPYLVLSWNPAWLKFLPKPGAWMERFKVAMGFPMIATALWLFTLAITHYEKRIIWLGVLAVIVAFITWVFGEFIQRKRTPGGIVAIIILALAAAWSVVKLETKPFVWEPWSPAAVSKAQGEHRPVLIDFTADWCFTCNTVVKPALESTAVRNKFKEVNAVTLIADYTKFPPEIGAELQKFGRAGVPLVVVYPKDSSRAPIVLPEALTPGMVVNALNDAAK
jgi:thiol:disulfide interchange protein